MSSNVNLAILSEVMYLQCTKGLYYFFQDLFVLLDLIGTGDVVFKNFFPETAYHFKWLQKIGNIFSIHVLRPWIKVFRMLEFLFIYSFLRLTDIIDRDVLCTQSLSAAG